MTSEDQVKSLQSQNARYYGGLEAYEEHVRRLEAEIRRLKKALALISAESVDPYESVWLRLESAGSRARIALAESSIDLGPETVREWRERG